MTQLRSIAIEATMVVFAVLVALAVDEWREERQLHDFADRARTAVVAEMRANLDEFDQTAAALESTVALLGEVVDGEDVSLLGGGLDVAFPEVSSAAWQAAQAGQAAPYLDYDWMIRAGRAYEVNRAYNRVADEAIDDMAAIIGSGPTLETLGRVYGRLVVLTGIHAQVQESYRRILGEDGS